MHDLSPVFILSHFLAPNSIDHIFLVVVRIKRFPEASLFECLVIREWHCLRRIRKYGLVGIGRALLEEMCH